EVVAAADGEAAAVRAEGQALDRPGQEDRLAGKFLAGRRVPEADLGVTRRVGVGPGEAGPRSDPVAVGADRQRVDALCVPPKGELIASAESQDVVPLPAAKVTRAIEKEQLSLFDIAVQRPTI